MSRRRWRETAFVGWRGGGKVSAWDAIKLLQEMDYMTTATGFEGLIGRHSTTTKETEMGQEYMKGYTAGVDDERKRNANEYERGYTAGITVGKTRAAVHFPAVSLGQGDTFTCTTTFRDGEPLQYTASEMRNEYDRGHGAGFRCAQRKTNSPYGVAHIFSREPSTYGWRWHHRGTVPTVSSLREGFAEKVLNCFFEAKLLTDAPGHYLVTGGEVAEEFDVKVTPARAPRIEIERRRQS